jgi:glycosyltransferase involved in cell wall biosynthesis
MLAGSYALSGNDSFDLVVGTSPPLGAAELGARIAAQRCIPFVMEVRDLWPDVIFDSGYGRLRAIAPLLYRWEASLYHRSAHVVTVTPSFIPLLEAKGLSPRQISIVPPGIDCQAIASGSAVAAARARELRAELKLEGQYVALYLGNHGASQGLDVLIESAPLLAPDTVLVLAGDGWEKPRLQQRARELGCRNVHFLPPLPRAEVAGLYALADACLVTLRGSAFMQHFLPSKLVEVLAYGKPVLSNIGGEGARLIHALRAGEVLPDYRPQAVAEVLNRWAAQGGPAGFEAQAVSAYMQREYDSQVLAGRYLALLQSLCR